jgi:hypothetical protein
MQWVAGNEVSRAHDTVDTISYARGKLVVFPHVGLQRRCDDVLAILLLRMKY